MTTQYTETAINWGPSGEVVHKRTYARPTPSGERETWPETCDRVATGNLSLVHGPKIGWTEEVWRECDRLMKYMVAFAILPAGRHLWASGVKGRQYLFNCHHSGWTDKLSRHFAFQSERLFEGGGVGANYSMREIGEHTVRRALKVHVVCDREHADYQEMKDAGLLSEEFDADWPGTFDVEDTREGWSAATVDLIDTYMAPDGSVLHGDRVFDVSRVRRKGSRLKSSGGTASGPLPLAQLLATIEQTMNGTLSDGRSVAGLVNGLDAMDIDHAIAAAVVAGGTRRSARMSIMHWKDPLIFQFINCKSDRSKHWTTNISVEIDKEFIDALNLPEWNHAKEVHKRVVTGMLTNGEPGYWNSDLSNVGEVDRVSSTNPCGEIALVPFENCNLGHINLDYFAPTRKGGPPNRLGLDEAHVLMTRFLIRATFGDVNDEEQARLLVRNRRIGVGHLGVQGYLAKRGIRYSQAPDTAFPKELRALYKVVREAARECAFELRIAEPIKVTTVAPTGSVAKLPGATEGIHPVLFRYYLQGIRFNRTDPDQAETIAEAQEAGFNVEVCQYDATGNTYFVQYPTKHQLVAEVEALGYDPDIVEIASEISLGNMLAFQAMYQQNYADNAVSFTANVQAEYHQQDQMLRDPFGLEKPEAPSDTRLQDTMNTIKRALPMLKGTTIMLDGARPQAPYIAISKADFELYDAIAKMAIGDGTDIDCATGACPVK